MNKLFVPVLLILTLCFNSHSADFSRLETFTDDEKLWDISSDNFLDGSNEMYFKWLSDKKNEVRYPGYSNSPGMTFLGMKSWETIIRFEEGKVSQIEISIYNRGDSGEISDEKTFQTAVEETVRKLDEWSGEKGVSIQKERLKMGMYLEKKVWVKNNSLAVELRWSASERIKTQDLEDPRGKDRKIKFRAEYIKIIAGKFDPKSDPRKMASAPKKADTASAVDIKQNVKKDADGFAYIENIPMVDQGNKGYCAVATAERILKYYGTDVDQNMLAQLANSSAAKGTSSSEMLDMLKKVQAKFGVFVRVHDEIKIQSFTGMVSDYNRLAKKAGKRQITYGNNIDVGGIYNAMDPELLKKTKCEKDKSGFKNFQSDIMKHVDLGIPLIWSVILGIVEEKGLPQAGGGHMRIISGYNREKNEIMYSDSWGKGHENKKMTMDDAWTITTGLYSFDPRKK
ncbi:MAG: C39 family peptidase [Victivallales bacterium]